MNAFLIILLYFLFDRELNFILHSETLTVIYATLSKISTAILIFYILAINREKKSYKLFGCIFLSLISLVFSTVIMNGNLQRVFMMTYPLFGMAALTLIACRNQKEAMKYVSVISNLYYILAIVNFVFLIMSPNMFNNSISNANSFFLGLENQLGYPLIKGLGFILIDYYFNKKILKLIIYLVVHIATIFIVFSGSNVVGFVIALALIIPNLLQKGLQYPTLKKILLMFSILFVFIMFFNGLITILESSHVKYIIEDLLGKNVTLTNRTVIWDIVIRNYLESPILGQGVQDTVNLFYISEKYSSGYFSAHNQFFQSLYEGGILYYLSLIPLVFRFSNALECTLPKIKQVFVAVFISLLFMFMGEAIGMGVIIMLMINGIAISESFQMVKAKSIL